MDAMAIRRLIAEGKYSYSRHAERERQADMSFTYEIEEAFRNCDIIGDYPDDPRGPSCLILGFSGQRPLPAVCSIKQNPEEVLLITVYDPSKHPAQRTDRYQRRRK
jgi:hypothetical protein